MSERMKIPLIRPRLPDKKSIWKYFDRSITAGLYSNNGPCYLEAQRKIKELTTYNTLVSNATVGLELSLRAKLKQGSKVLIPSFTFKATYLAVKNAGMIPVVTKSMSHTWALDPDPMDCDAMVVVSPFGHEIDFSLYEHLPVPVFYDLAGAWGHYYKGNNVAVYSFHATKNLAIGEGGCCVSNDLELIERISWLARFGHTNAKLDELHSATLCAALDMKKEENSLRIYKKLNIKMLFSTLPSAHTSLIVSSFHPETIYNLLSNNVFITKRYYYPLIEDGYDCETRIKTPKDSPMRFTIALPRDITKKESEKITNFLEQ